MSDFKVELVRPDIKNANHILIRGYFADDDPKLEMLSVRIDGHQVQSVFSKRNLNETRRDYCMHGKDVYEEYYTFVCANNLSAIRSLEIYSGNECIYKCIGAKLKKVLSQSAWQLDAAEIVDGKTLIYGKVPHACDLTIAVEGWSNAELEYMDDARIGALYPELENGNNTYVVIKIPADDKRAKYKINITEIGKDTLREEALIADIDALSTAVLYGDKYGALERFKRYTRRYGLFAAVGHYAKRAVIRSTDYTYADFCKKYQVNVVQNSSVQGEYQIFLCPDMTLTDDAIARFNDEFSRGAEIVYADEDVISEAGEYTNPRFKSGFSLEYLYNTNYIGFPVAVKNTLLDDCSIKSNRLVTDNKQWYDNLLTLCEKTDKIVHIEKILAHAKPRNYFFSAQDVVREHLDKRAVAARLEEGIIAGSTHISYEVKDNPQVSIIIPNKDNIDILKRCVDSIVEKSVYRNFEILIVENNSSNPETFSYYKSVDGTNNIRVLYYPDSFNFSAINNFGVREAKGEYLLLLNNDTELLKPDSLQEMIGICQQKNVGMVGALLYFPDDTIQHAGVAIGLQGLANHIFSGERDITKTYLSEAAFSHDMSAVTAACLMMKKSLYDELDGFDERLTVAFNDVDLCLRVKEKGLGIIYTPYACFYHYESKSRGHEDSVKKQRREEGEVQLCGMKHEEYLANIDPFYNRNLTRIYMNASYRR